MLSTLPLLFSTQSIALQSELLGTENHDEFEPLTTIAVSTNPAHPILLCNDCLLIALECMDNRTDLQNFRFTSKQFNYIYGQYKVRQNIKFSKFRSLFNQSNHRCLEDLVQSIPMMTGIFAVLDVNSSECYVATLFHVHLQSKRNMVRGLTVGQHEPFLSILLWDDIDWNRFPIILICAFDGNDVRITLNLKSGFEKVVTFHPLNFGFEDLNLLLQNKRTSLRPFPAEGLPATIWTFERRWYCTYFSSWREMKICMIGAVTNVFVFTTLWLFVL